MLLAPSRAPAVSVRVRGQTSATCSSVDWPQQALGCWQRQHPSGVPLLGKPGPSHRFFSMGMTLERCSTHCGEHGTPFFMVRSPDAPTRQCPNAPMRQCANAPMPKSMHQSMPRSIPQPMPEAIRLPSPTRSPSSRASQTSADASPRSSTPTAPTSSRRTLTSAAARARATRRSCAAAVPTRPEATPATRASTRL